MLAGGTGDEAKAKTHRRDAEDAEIETERDCMRQKLGQGHLLGGEEHVGWCGRIGLGHGVVEVGGARGGF
jgi:hypothetical protein